MGKHPLYVCQLSLPNLNPDFIYKADFAVSAHCGTRFSAHFEHQAPLSLHPDHSFTT